FDLRRLEAVGPVFPLVEEVAYDTNSGSALFDVSRNGVLAYLSGKGGLGGRTVQWLDASGRFQPLLVKPGNYTHSVSPDGTRLGLIVRDGAGGDIWVYDWKRDTMTRLTFGSNALSIPKWFPDGKWLVYRADDGLYWIRVDGSGKPQLLAGGKPGYFPYSF